MAFSMDGLTLVGPDGNGSGQRIWTYASADAIADVNTSAYMNAAAGLLAVRDIIFVTDTATPTLYIVIVLSISAAGVVDLSDGTVIAETDSD